VKKAEEQQLGELHGTLANVLKDAITRPYADKDTGESIPPPAALLNVARQFLKDNKIEAIAVEGSPLASLADLPEFDEDQNIYPLRKTN
jgi:hypothetical protein